jgi:hypothetical protein
MARQDVGSFIPTTQVWDVSELYSTEVTSPKFKELLIRLYQQVGNIAMAINGKDTGIYDTSEFVCGQTFFPNPNPIAGQPNKERQVYRKVINFGPLPVRIPPATSANISIAHGIPGINSGTQFTRIYGCSSKKTATTYVPIPYAWPNDAKESIALFASATDVTIVTGDTGTWANYDDTIVVIEYLKQ